MIDGRRIYSAEHHAFRDMVRRFFAKEITPNIAQWEENGLVPREFWTLCGRQGLLCPTLGPEYGGAGGDFLHQCVLCEELGYSGQMSTTLQTHNDIIAPYIEMLGTPEQKKKWLPKMVTGEVIGAVAMTEPQAGSDLKAMQTRARREGDQFVITGQKTYITLGHHADLIIVACKTSPEKGSKGVSLILVETDRPGFRRGRMLKKMGMKASDTAELFFDEVHVPAANLLGTLDAGFTQIMSEIPKERVSIATCAMGAAQKAFDITVAWVHERKVFGKTLYEFQNTQFKLAELKTQLAAGWALLDSHIVKLMEHKLATDEAAMTKLFCTELQCRVVDDCLQMFGGAGYMADMPIARMYVDARVRRIAGGSSEIMKKLIARGI
jgi:acyl-CoA dehydrogenase